MRAGVPLRFGAGTQTAMSDAAASRYTRAMQCFAPPSLAEAALRERLAQLQPAESSEVILREITFVKASLAALLQRQGNSTSEAVWRDAQESCKKAKLLDCSQSGLSAYAQKICPKL